MRDGIGMEPIRVLHVVTYMGRGGLETMIMNYYRHIDRAKVQFDFLVHRKFEADYDKEIEALGGKIYRMDRLNPVNPEYLRELNKFFAEHQEYKIVHSHLDCMAGIPLKYAKKNGIPVRIAHSHNNSQAKDAKYLLKLFYKRNIPRYSNYRFACAEEAGKWMFGNKKFRLLNNAIDTKDYVFNEEIAKNVKKELGIPSDAVVIGNVGRFAPQKNHVFLIKIFSEMARKNSNVVLVLVGDGELRKDIQEQVEKLGICDKVIFTGVRKDVSRLLQVMDVFLFPSLHEGLPVSIVEAQAAGVPCIISDKVPIECKMTDLVQQISLEESIERWVDAVFKTVRIQKKDQSSEIRKANFDVCENAKWLERFYIKSYENLTCERIV